MKANKFMLAGMLVAALAMVGCEPKEPVTNPDQGGEEEPTEVEVPVINSPGKGKTSIAIYVPEDTPRGAYLVGSFNKYTISDDSVSFTKVDGEERWYAATIDVEPSLLVKAIARPSDESVALAWSYQWGMNIDPDDKDCKVTEDHVILLQGAEAGSLVFENGGEVKLSITADDAVIFIEVKEWKTTPVIPDVPAATAWMKHPFDGTNWTWKEMTKTADATFTLAARFGGKGCNIAETKGGAENWIETITVEEGSEVPAKGDSVLFTFVSTKGNVGSVSMKLIEKSAITVEPIKSVVKAKVPAEWTNEITAWIWWDGNTGEVVTPTKEGDWYVVSPAEAVTGLGVIFRNGTDWGTGQSDNITPSVEQACYNLTLKEGEMNASVTEVDCE